MKIKNRIFIIALVISVFAYTNVSAAYGIFKCNNGTVDCLCIDPAIPKGRLNTIANNSVGESDYEDEYLADLIEQDKAYIAAKSKYDNAKTKVDNAESALTKAKKALTDAQNALAEAKAKASQKGATADDKAKLKTARENVESAEKKVKSAEEKLQTANEALTKASQKIDEAKTKYNTDLTKGKNHITKDKDVAIEKAMLYAIAGGINKTSSTAARMIACYSGYSNGDCKESKQVDNRTYNDLAQHCLSSDNEARDNWAIITGKSVKVVKNPNPGTGCKLFKESIKKAADYKQGITKSAVPQWKDYARKPLDNDEVLLIAKVTIKNSFDDAAIFTIKDIKSKKSLGQPQVVGYLKYDPKDVVYSPSYDTNKYTNFELGTDIIKAFKEFGYKRTSTIKENGKEKISDVEYELFIAFKLKIDKSIDKKNNAICSEDLLVTYGFTDQSAVEGKFYSTPNSNTVQRFIVNTGNYEKVTVKDGTSGLYISGKYDPNNSKDRIWTFENVDICNETCEPIGKTATDEAGFAQICKDGDTPDTDGNVTYMYREGFKNGYVNIKECLYNNTDVAENPYNLVQAANRYCDVACREEYTFVMPYKRDVSAGRYFKLGVQVKGELTCYSSAPDYDRFQRDLLYAQHQLVEKYNQYAKSVGKNGYDYTIVSETSIVVPNEATLPLVKDTSLKNKALTELKQAQNTLKSYIDDYNSCAKWDVAYHFDPEVAYAYNEPILSKTKWANNFSDAKNKMKKIPSDAKTSVPTQTQYCYTELNDDGTCPQPQTSPASNRTISYVTCSESGCKTIQNTKINGTGAIIKSASATASYDTPRVFYMNASSGTVRVSSENDKKSGESVVEGLPVALNTPTGTYYYRFRITNVGMYFNDPTGKLGRIYGGNKSFSSVRREKKVYDSEGLTVDQNDYACTYSVNEPLCKGHTTDECRFNATCVNDCKKKNPSKTDAQCRAECNAETRDECIKRVCPVCTNNPEMDLTDCIDKCKATGKTAEECKKQCEQTECGYCVKEAQGYYYCPSTHYEEKCELQPNRDAALKKVNNDPKRNFNCCPNCTIFCVNGKCVAETKCVGANCPIKCTGKNCVQTTPLTTFREVSTSNINPNNRQMGFNWNTSNPTNTLVAEKAQLTINNIQRKANATPTTNNNGSGAGGATGKPGDNSLTVEMGPSETKDTRQYNKDPNNHGYASGTMKCDPVLIPSEEIKDETTCKNNSYIWKKDKCYIENGKCYSEYLDKIFGKQLQETNREKSKKAGLTPAGDTTKNATYYTDSYNTYAIYKSNDVNGDGIADVGPASR